MAAEFSVEQPADDTKPESRPDALRRRMRRLRRTIVRPLWRGAIRTVAAPRLRVTFCLFLWGAVLCGASLLVGNGSMHASGSWVELRVTIFQILHQELEVSGAGLSQVGFLAAPNWSVTTVAIWPAMYYVLRSLIDSADRVFAGVDGSPMTWGPSAGNETVSATWRRHRRTLARLAVLFLVAGLLFSFFEWLSESGMPLLRGADPGSGERDWSAIDANGKGSNWPQALFTLAAFAYQGVALAIMATFAAATLLMARTMGRHGSGEEKPALLVDIMSNDPSRRMGFERFVVVIDYMIVFVALAFANFFLSRIQNAYLHHDGLDGHPNLLEFIRQDFTVHDVSALPSLFEADFDDFSSIAVAIGAVVLLFHCFFFFNATLRHAALQARNRSDIELLKDGMSGRAGLEPKEIRERLREANVWPLGYSDFMPTLSFLTICMVTIIAYRIGLYLVFLWIAGWILARAAQGLIKR